MTKRTAGRLVTLLSRLRPGDSSLTRVVVVAMGVEVVTPLISPSHLAHSSITDNYCMTVPPVKDLVEDRNLRDLIQSVNSNVVFHVPSVQGRSQKKDISSFQVQDRIKHVKPVL